MFERAVEFLKVAGPSLALRLLAALLILSVAYLLAGWLSRSAERITVLVRDGRVAGLAPLSRSVVKVGVLGAGAAMALDQLGVSIAALLAGAGVVGLAVGFGAQNLVKDCISGFFLILDGVIAEGDIVHVDGTDGTVEKVGLRMTHVRAFNGQLWYLPNGEIKRVGNWNRDWARVVVQVGLAYEQEVSRGLEALARIGKQWAEEHAELVLEPPEAQGVMGLNGSDVTVRLVIKIDNSTKQLWPAERELRKRVKEAFDREGIEIPFARQVLYLRKEGEVAVAEAPKKTE
mgnify:CR=1 FL=1